MQAINRVLTFQHRILMFQWCTCFRRCWALLMLLSEDRPESVCRHNCVDPCSLNLPRLLSPLFLRKYEQIPLNTEKIFLNSVRVNIYYVKVESRYLFNIPSYIVKCSYLRYCFNYIYNYTINNKLTLSYKSWIQTGAFTAVSNISHLWW